MALKIVLFASFLAFGASSVFAQSCCTRLQYQTFSDSLASIQNEILIDVRPLKNNYKYSIKGAKHCGSIADLEEFLNSLDKNKSLFFYCDIGERSQKAAKIACDKGFLKVYDLKGGMTAWRKNKMPVFSGKN